MEKDKNKTEFVHLNKGHFSLEPDERLREFNRKLGSGWENNYKEYRQLWDELPKKREVRDYPLLVDLEMASVCNLKCPMCPTTTEIFKDKRIRPFKQGRLDFDLAKKIIDEISGKVYALRLSWVGEPTLHKNLVDVIRYAKEKGINEISFLTNGSKMTLDYFKEIVEAGIDWITISVDGMGENYNKIRKPLKFDETLQKIKDIHEYKLLNKLDKPVIKIQGVWPAIKDSPEIFYNTFEPLVDMIAFNPLIDYLHKDKDIVFEENFTCPQHYQRIVISSNGKAALCSNDDLVETIIGDANTQTIHEIWHGNEMNKIRETQKKKDGFKEISPCVKCYYPRKTMEDEIAFINGRKISIENYINRSQVIGQ